MKKLSHLWDALEDSPRLRGVRQELADVLQPEYEVVAPFLRRTGEVASSYPCPFPGGHGCPRKILKTRAPLRAVCGRVPKECDEILLTLDDIQILRFDSRQFARRLQDLLGIAPPSHPADDQGDVIPLGMVRPPLGKRTPVILLMAGSDQAAATLVAGAERKYRQGAVLLTPTDQFIDAEMEGRFPDEKIRWMVLSDLILMDSKTLVASRKLEALIQLGVTAHASHPLPARGGKKPRGKPADVEGHLKVARVVSNIGNRWSSELAEVCRQLQSAGVAFPKSIENTEFVDSWEDLADGIDGPRNAARRERLTKHITYRLKWVLKNQPTEESLPKVSR